MPAPTIQDLEIDEFSASSVATFDSLSTGPSAISLPATRKNSTCGRSSSDSDSPDHLEKEKNEHSEDEDEDDASATQSKLPQSTATTPMVIKRRESAPASTLSEQLSVEIKCKSMLAHQERLHSLIPLVQANHKSLYTNYRRLEEDIAGMQVSPEFEHCKQIPCKQIRQTFDEADIQLEQLREQVVDHNGMNRKKARQFAEKLTQANISKKFNQRSCRLDELTKQAHEQLEWMKSISLDREIDDIVDQLADVQKDLGGM